MKGSRKGIHIQYDTVSGDYPSIKICEKNGCMFLEEMARLL